MRFDFDAGEDGVDDAGLRYPCDALHPALAVRASEDINREHFQQHRGPRNPSPPDGLARGDLLVGDAVAAGVGIFFRRRFRDDEFAKLRIWS